MPLPHIALELEAALATAEPSRSSAPQALLGTARLPRLLGFAALEWLGIVACWLAIERAPAFCYPVLALIIAGRLHALGVLLHDVAHMPLQRKTMLVRLLEAFCGYPLATTLNAMRYHHLRHHKDSGMSEDPYFKGRIAGRPAMWLLFWLRGAILIPFWLLRAPFGLLAVLIPALRTPYGRVFLQDRSKRTLCDDREVLATAKAELGQLLFHLGLLALAIIDAERVLYFYLIPAAAAGLLASYRLLAEHNYESASDRRISTILRTTNDHGLSLIGRLFLAPRNIGYHVVHHVHPQVALENLPALRAWYRSQYPSLYR